MGPGSANTKPCRAHMQNVGGKHWQHCHCAAKKYGKEIKRHLVVILSDVRIRVFYQILQNFKKRLS